MPADVFTLIKLGQLLEDEDVGKVIYNSHLSWRYLSTFHNVYKAQVGEGSLRNLRLP